METGKGYVFRQLLLVLSVCVIGLAFLAIGLMVGYAVLGEGKDPISILKPETWQAIVAKFTEKKKGVGSNPAPLVMTFI
mgnify:FL=1